MSILIFDDDNKIIEPAISILEHNLNLDVDYTTDPEYALRKILSGQCEILIMEVLSPRISGIEICELINFDDRLRKIKVILISSLPLYSDKFEQSLKNFQELKVIRGVLEKPFTPYDLVAKIMSIKM